MSKQFLRKVSKLSKGLNNLGKVKINYQKGKISRICLKNLGNISKISEKSQLITKKASEIPLKSQNLV